MDLSKLRNIGISAHIDSGKTTLSERILYYAGRIHRMQEVRGGDGGATMDHMELERERGITITSAATSLQWNGHGINLIDTPGHVDFTVEVERSLRVLDGAVLVLCAVGGVQTQSMTVDRQMKRYGVPRIAFINKMDRTGSNPLSVVEQIKNKLGSDAVLLQYPIGEGQNFEAIVDLIAMKLVQFSGEQGEKIEHVEVPADIQDDVEAARQQMLESLSMYSDELMELLLSEAEVPEELIHKIVREATQAQELTPVMLGTAFRNKGVQLLLDAVVRYLPSPVEREIKATDPIDPEKTIKLEPDPSRPTVAMAFKIVDDPYGQLTFVRVYQGTLNKGEMYFNQRTGRKERFSRIVRMHADEREEVDSAAAGDIVAVMGIDSASGDTYAAEPKFCTLENIFVAEPVIKMAIEPLNRGGADKLGKALQRFRKEDPTFRVFTDAETNETVIAGMGELHLEIYIERIRREFGVEVSVGAPKVSYRESPTKSAKFDFKHKKQTGGSGQYAHIVGMIEPLPDDAEEIFVFEDTVTGGRIPKEYIPAVERGMRDATVKGPLAGFPIEGVKVTLEDGSYHEVDSSDMAFMICGRNCFNETFLRMKPALLEPIMTVSIECPDEFQGAVVGDVSSRRGQIVSTESIEGTTTIMAEVPLAETFGYSTDLRSMTQGQGVFQLELARYRKVPSSIQETIIEEKKKASLVGAK
jgi:elongation factor G